MPDATIRDVARRAQVSVASVSRALNGLDNVSEATKARIGEAVRDLGYVPHAGARSLSLSRTSAIGVVLPDLHGEFFSEIMRGMDHAASSRGYLLLLSSLHAGREQAAQALRAMHGRVDGLIVMAPHLSSEALAAALPPGLPAVLVNSRGASARYSEIQVDNRAGARAVVEHLVAIGRRRLVYIAGPSENSDARERADAFIEAATQAEVEWQIVSGDFEEESGDAAIRALIAGGHRFDAVFAANDNMAIGAMQALRAAGLGIPGEVAIAGFDDIPLARHLGLTTVRVRIAELGMRALETLIAVLDVATPFPELRAPELHAPELIVRSTTGQRGDDE